MPVRKIPLVTGNYYHLVNRGVASTPIFLDRRHYERFLDTLLYYQDKNPPRRFSYFQRQLYLDKQKIEKQPKDFLVNIIGYCFIPNHFHILVEQIVDHGISDFMRRVSNSYTRYFNTKNKRIGPIFQGNFKSVLIESEEQLLHVLRYIHLNPYSAEITKTLDDLTKFPHSSLPEYLRLSQTNYCQKEVILSYFKTPYSFKNFILNHADSQKKLHQIKSLLLDHTPGV